MLDVLKWGCAVLLCLVALFGAHVGPLSTLPFATQVLLGLLAMILALYVVALTTQGRSGLIFLKEAGVEVKKVVWPSRQETSQATFVVILIVLLMSVLLWVIDTVLFSVVAWLTGQGVS
jgi:preprotein translocase subunit SecE